MLSACARGRPEFLAAYQRRNQRISLNSCMYTATNSPAGPSPSEVRGEVYAWLQRLTPQAEDASARYAVTLTFDLDRMRRMSKSGLLDGDEAVAMARHNFATFRVNLDCAIYKNAAVRYGRELTYVPVIEGQGRGERIHYHCVIVTPSRVDLRTMTAAVKRAWLQTEFGAVQTDVQHMRDDGWLSYISKEAWTIKRDSVDIDNVRLASGPKRC